MKWLYVWKCSGWTQSYAWFIGSFTMTAYEIICKAQPEFSADSAINIFRDKSVVSAVPAGWFYTGWGDSLSTHCKLGSTSAKTLKHLFDWFVDAQNSG